MGRVDAAYCEIDLPAGVLGAPLQAAFEQPQELLLAWRPDQVGPLLERAETLSRAGAWLVGLLTYEAAAAFDVKLRTHPPVAGLPLALFAAFAAPTQPRPRHGLLCGPWRDSLGRAQFDAALAKIQQDIAAGRHYQVNFTAPLVAGWDGDAAALFDALRVSQPGAYGIYLEWDRWRAASVSPELFFHWAPDATGAGRLLTTRPMKGTGQRHREPDADRAAAEALAASEKERAENLMIVDLLRNDLGRIARLGSVAVPSLFALEPWATVWQMTSTVQCRTRPEVRLRDVFAALFPCGSVTGAPKIEAMAAIVEREAGPRGLYCGALGVLMPGGEACFNVPIRTLTLDQDQRLASCGIGSGIVADSSAAGEHREWRAKSRFLRRAILDFQLIETLVWRRGRYWLLDAHLGRMGASAQVFGFPWRRDAIRQALDQAAAGFRDGQWRVRLLVDGAGGIQLETQPFSRSRTTAVCALAQEPVWSADPRLRHKTTRREPYQQGERPGYFDTLLWNERGEATEFTRGNLVARLDGRLITPPLASGLLPGLFRAALLKRGTLAEAPLPLIRLGAADRLWLINSVRGAVRVRLAPDGSSGPARAGN